MNKYAELALAIARLTSNAELKAAVDQAITSSVDTLASKRDATEASKSLWSGWNHASLIAAGAGFTASDMSNLLDMRIAELTNGDESKAKALATYKSRASNLVPVLALNDEEFGKVWVAAEIKDSEGKPSAPTRMFNTQIATKVLRAAKGQDNAVQAAYEAAFQRLITLIRDTAKVGKGALEGMNAKEKAAARAQAWNEAKVLCDSLYEIATEGATEQLVALHDADVAVAEQAEAING